MNKVEIVKITLTLAIATVLVAILMIPPCIHATETTPLGKVMNLLSEVSESNCTIVKIESTLPTRLIVTIHCPRPVPSTILKEYNCTNTTGQEYSYRCLWIFKRYLVKASTSMFRGHRIYALETHLITVGTVITHPAISATSIITCSGSRCIVMVYGLTNIRDLAVITPGDVHILYCDGLNLARKLIIGRYLIYMFHVAPSIRLAYSSRGVFFSKCAVITTRDFYHNMLIGNISLGVATGIAAALLAIMVIIFVTLRRH